MTTRDEQQAMIAEQCGFYPQGSQEYSTCVIRIQTENPVSEGSSKAAKAVPWATVPAEQYGVAVPTKSGTVFKPQQVGTITSQAQVDYIKDNNSSFNNYTGVEKSNVPSFFSLPSNEQAMFDQAAKSIHPLKTGSSYYQELIDTSYDMSKMGVVRSPQMLAYEQLTGAAAGSGSGGSGGGGGGGGPKINEYETRMAKADIRKVADDLAAEMIGRPVTDQEFEKLLKRQRKAERNNPRVIDVQGNRQIDKQGLTQQGREDIMRKQLGKSDEYKDYQLSTTAMDAVLDVIKRDKGIAGE